ncbi:MAG: hypothetical protein ACK5P7_09210 [Bdellovibrio sp.]|jgi:chromosome segregation ATPase
MNAKFKNQHHGPSTFKFALGQAIVLSILLSPAPSFGQRLEWKEGDDAPSPASSADSSRGLYQKTGEAWASPPSYPEDALRHAFEQEKLERKKIEKAREDLLAVKEAYEQKKVDAEREILAKRFAIENARQEAERAHNETATLRTEIVGLDGQMADVNNQLNLVKSQTEEHVKAHKQVTAELQASQKSLELALASLKKTREESFRKINDYQVAIQRSKAQIFEEQAQIAKIDNDKARAEAEELVVRSRLNDLQSQLNEVKGYRQRLQSELGDLRRRLDLAKGDLGDAKNEYLAAEKNKNQLESMVKATRQSNAQEMRRLENEIAALRNKKNEAEAESVRYQAEADKLNQNLAMVKVRNAEAQASAEEAQGFAMESRLKFETAQTELKRELSGAQAGKMKRDTMAVKLRGLANMETGSGFTSSGKVWTVTQDCDIRQTSVGSGPKVGSVKSGERVIASEEPGGVVKLLNKSGTVAYVPARCGQFKD